LFMLVQRYVVHVSTALCCSC